MSQVEQKQAASHSWYSMCHCSYHSLIGTIPALSFKFYYFARVSGGIWNGNQQTRWLLLYFNNFTCFVFVF